MSSEQQQLPSIGKMLQLTFEKWYEDNIPRHAAVLAFYALFAVAPILLLCVEVMGWVYGRDEAELRVQEQITSFVNSPETGEWVRILLGDILPSSANWWVTAGFVIALLFGASNFFGELKVVINQIWDVPFSLDVGFGELAFRRMQAVLMVLAGSFLIVGGFVVTSWLSGITDFATTFLNLGSGYATWSYLILIFFLFTIFFALIYKFVPDVDVAWQDVWIGAAATALLISITRLVISLYFAYSHTMTMFGAASALVVILLSVYYAAQIFFLGAEFTRVYSLTHGSGLKRQQGLQEDHVADSEGHDEVLIQHSVNGQDKRESKEPVEIAITNLEPVLRSGQDESMLADGSQSNSESDPSIRAILAQRARNAWKYLPSVRNVSKDETTARHPDEHELTQQDPVEPHSAEHELADPPTTSPQSTHSVPTDPQFDDPTDESTSIESNSQENPSRLRQLLALPIRIIRPVREVFVAVGVIGAISVAAFMGIPFWRNRRKDSEPPE